MPFPVAQTVRHRKECPDSPDLGTTERSPCSHTHGGFALFFGFWRQQGREYSAQQWSSAEPREVFPGSSDSSNPSCCTIRQTERSVLPLWHMGDWRDEGWVGVMEIGDQTNSSSRVSWGSGERSKLCISACWCWDWSVG